MTVVSELPIASKEYTPRREYRPVDQIEWDVDRLAVVVIDLVCAHCCDHTYDEPYLRKALNENLAGEGWYLDSLTTFQAAAYVCQFFGLTREEDQHALLSQPDVALWAQRCASILTSEPGVITFSTSGSTGSKKFISHPLDQLKAEALLWSSRYPWISEIRASVPSHHVYGFIWTVLLPSLLGVPVIECRKKMPHSIMNRPERALWVTIPQMLSYLDFCAPYSASYIDLVVSAGPCSIEELREARDAGCASVTQIYGSTETLGVGWRLPEKQEYTLMESISREGDGLVRAGSVLDVQDVLQFSDNTHFAVQGRKDKVIQLNGYNVSVAEVKSKLSALQCIADIGLKAMLINGEHRLRAFVVASPDVTESAIRKEIDACLDGKVFLSDVTFGRVLPLNAMGKLADW